MKEIVFKPENFRPANNLTEFMDKCGKSEYESNLCWQLNKHIKNNIPFTTAIEHNYDQTNMVKAGYLNDLGDRWYTLTRKSLGLLWSVFGVDAPNEFDIKNKKYTGSEVKSMLEDLHTIMENKASVDLNNEIGNDFVFNQKRDRRLENFNLKDFIKERLG
jgi:hypothetical protein